jgi:secreted trypsin-like serine protease
MRPVLAPVVALLAALLTLATAGDAPAATGSVRVVGGTYATTADAPWQVLVLPNGYLCGGAILDATHVVTAAHCVYDDAEQEIIAPSTVTVHAGITNRFTAGQHPAVAAVGVDPDYDPDMQTSDVAILTLATPLSFADPAVAPIELTDVGYRAGPADDLRLSGWGSDVARAPEDETEPQAVDDLNVVTLHTSTGCSAVYAPFDDNLLLCAGQAGLDACQGDSGGPLAVQLSPSVWRLAGIVTGGAGCAWSGYPGYYARVADPGIHAYLAQRGAGYSVQDPTVTSPPTITGTPAPGGTLACSTGTWQNAYAYGVGFLRGDVVVRTGTTMVVTAADVGTTVSCLVEAYGLTGTAEATSAPVTIGPAAPPAAATVPAPTVAVVPIGDTAAPTARVVKLRCSHTVCILDVRVDDPAPSDGVKGVDARVSTAYRTTCVKNRKRRPCTKSVDHRLKTVATGATTFRIVTPRLRRGAQTFRLLGIDMRGNRQAKATTVKKTTR